MALLGSYHHEQAQMRPFRLPFLLPIFHKYDWNGSTSGFGAASNATTTTFLFNSFYKAYAVKRKASVLVFVVCNETEAFGAHFHPLVVKLSA